AASPHTAEAQAPSAALVWSVPCGRSVTVVRPGLCAICMSVSSCVRRFCAASALCRCWVMSLRACANCSEKLSDLEATYSSAPKRPTSTTAMGRPIAQAGDVPLPVMREKAGEAGVVVDVGMPGRWARPLGSASLRVWQLLRLERRQQAAQRQAEVLIERRRLL